ncbi:MAG: M10 family metallopeptidase C-terminal domain-containing protein [Maritimibacter sp.]|nr:M10 family metallopeptidase C-terminal domain-containing protein [Maritimibacter sp.]
MPSESDIIQALQMDFFHAAQAINGSGDPAFTITYRFEDSTPEDDITGRTGWSTWSTQERAAVHAALDHIESFLNVDFVVAKTGTDADLSLGLVTQPVGIAGYGGAELWTHGDGSVFSYDGFATYDKSLDLTREFNLILHELGHALGLEHPFEGTVLDPAYDSNHYTVMSYASDPESGTDSDAMMVYDILALQDIWGAAEHNTGNNTYTGPRTDTADTIWDTGGTDTFDASARTGAVRLDLRDGAFSSFGSFEDVAIAFGVTIENAVGGAGADWLTGNRADNVLIGNAGGDLIKGKSGTDVLSGGRGGDKLKGGSDADLLKGGPGRDKLIGGIGSDTLQGDGGADVFVFHDGADMDVIRDFEPGTDSIAFIGHGGLSGILAVAAEIDGDVVFDLGGGDILVVAGVTLGALENDLFVG